MKLSTRMALAMVALVLLTALSVGLLSYRNIRSAILPRAAERIEVHVRVLAATLAAAVRGAREDAAGFREAAAIAGIVRAHLAGGTDPEDGLTEAAWRERLARRFAAELAAKPTYNIFRLIDFADGRELVRVDRLGENGAIRVVPDGQLEDTSALDFFKAAHTTPAGEIYVSPVQLSLGRRRAVRIPVLRIATIVETPDHQPFGMAVINVDMQPILQELAASPQPGAHIYVVDSRGNYLVHPGPGRLFAADLGKPERWQDDFPTFAAALQSDAVKSSLLTDAQGEKTLVGLASVVLAGGPRVGILEVTPLSTVMAPITAVGKSTLLAGLTAVLCAALFAVLLARSMTRPLVQMTTAVEAFPRNPETVMPAATGEIGVLARAFARMMAEVKDKTASLEKEVADHRRTEAELERRTDRERLLSAAVQSSNDFIITLTSDGIVTSWNPAAVRLFGWTDKEMFGRSIDQIVPDDRHHEVPHIFDTIARGEILDNYQTVRLSKDGRAITVSLSVAPIKLASGSVIGACSVARDITESIKAKERIEQEMHERRRITGILDNTINSMADAVLVGDRDGNIVLCNAAAQRVMNIREGMTPAQWTYAQQIFMADGVTPMPLQERPLMRAVRGELFEDYELTVHYPHAGTPITFVATGGPIRAGSQQAAGGVVVYHDVSEARETERQLRQAQKMEAVGQLTGGVAHDFNNILTVITGTIEILEEGVADRPELAAIAKMIDDAAARGAELTNHLLAFSRRQPLQPRDTNVNALIMEVGRLLRPTLGGNIEIESMLDDNASSALIDPSQLTTSLLNLALNARDAMPGGGKLTFETTDAILDDNYAGMNEEVGPGPYVMIAVSDNGSGIAPDIIDKVFEPFFTTKVLGKGSGLGLSMVYGFVKQSGGHIKIYSEVGHGSTIKMYLPRAATMAQQFTDMAPAEPIHGGYETVLIVEDDALVRTYVTAQVRALGYRTLAATNAAEALTLIDGDTPIDLLFTDVVMPGTMNGRQLADETRRRRPGIKVLFTSGYAENAIVHHGRLDPGVLLLAKPYRKQQLAQMIRIALGAMDDDSGGDAVAGATRQRAV